MNKDEAKNLLEINRDKMRKQKELNEQAEANLNAFDDDSSLISGPKNELDYQRMRKDIKESHNEKK